MKRRLLNINNLIIIVTLIMFFISIPTQVFAAEVGINQFLKVQIAGWYTIIRNASIAIMLILLIVSGIRMQVSAFAEDKALFKNAVPSWILGILIMLTIQYFMYFLIDLNQNLVNSSRDLGRSISGINEFGEENTLYETAKSKAYEPKFTSGTIGMILYMMLVFYTYKFVIVYAKRYFNVIILVLIVPILCLVSVFQKIIKGKNKGQLRKWTKEFIYNVFLQTLHAFLYSTLVGLILKLSENMENFIGAILVLIIFGFIFSIDAIIRKVFNFIGGSTSIKTRDVFGGIKQVAKDGYEFVTDEGKFSEKVNSIKSSVQQKLSPSNIRSELVKFKDNAIYETKETLAALDGKRVKVTEEQIQKEQEKLDNPNFIGKALNVFQKGAYGITEFGIEINENIKNKIKKKIQDLNQNNEMAKRLKRILKSHNKKRNKDLEQYDTSLNLDTSPKEVADELKDSIEKYGSDLLVAVYVVEGPQAFIHSEIGSSYMGMSVLASEEYETHYASLYTQDSEKRTLRLKLKRQKSKIKRYNFVRFNGRSVKTITHGLNKRFIMNSKYLTSLNKIATIVNLGNLDIKDFSGVEKTTIKYTAKVNSAVQKKHLADIELEKYEERKQDADWAVLTTMSMDIKAVRTNRVVAEVSKIMQQPEQNIGIEQLVDMRKAEKLDEDTVIIFEELDESIKMQDTLEVMTNVEIMDVAMQSGAVRIEEVNFQDEDLKEQILEGLIEKGIFGVEVKEDETVCEDIINTIQEMKMSISQEEYVESVARKEFIDIFDEDKKEVNVETNLDKLSQLIKDIAKETIKLEAENIKEELSEEIKYTEDKEELTKKAIQSEKESSQKKSKSEKQEKENVISSSQESERDSSKDVLIVYIHGAVVNEGRYDVKNGSRIYEVIKMAGGLTEEADLTAVSTYDIVFDGQVIFIPLRNDDEELEKTLERCRPVVEEVVKKYLIENNITNIQTLTKLVHKKMVLTKLKKALKNENLNNEQIEVLLDERIKEIKTIRNFFEKINSKSKVVNINDFKVNYLNIQDEKKRRKKAIENKQELELDEMIKQVSKGDSETEKNSDDYEKDSLKRLLEEMKKDGQKVLINRNSKDEKKQNLRTMYINQSPEDRMKFLLGRF